MHLFLFSNSNSRSSSSSGCMQVIQAERKPTQGTVALCVSPSPLPVLSATEPDAAPALISPLQTATLTGSAAPKLSAQSLRPPSSMGAKTLSASVCNPSERKGIQGERPSFTSIVHPPPASCSHTLDRTHHLWMTLFINKIQCALFLAAVAFVEVKLLWR